MRIAALFVEPDGPYSNLEGVEMWDEARDARKYAGPHPVIAHPPCARWSTLAPIVEKRWGYKRHQDDGCFASTIRSLDKFGGILEHPAYSSAWWYHGFNKPVRGAWTVARIDDLRWWTTEVDQGNYGHDAVKGTWLLACNVTVFPSLEWKKANGLRLGPGPRGFRPIESMSSSDPRRKLTPVPFRDVLLSIARSVRPNGRVGE